jgi:hypothetical protein
MPLDDTDNFLELSSSRGCNRLTVDEGRNVLELDLGGGVEVGAT